MYRLLKQCRLLASAALLFAVFILPVQAQQSSANLYDQAVEAMDAGNYRSAELLFRSIVQNNDEFSERASFQLAKSIHFQKRYLSAIFEFNRYLLVATNNETRSETRYWIAESYYQNGNKLQAIEEYKRYISQTITRNDLVVTSYRRIGFIYFSQRRFDESIIEWNRAISRAETESLKNSIRYDIAVAYFNSGQYRDAAKITNLIQKRSDEETIIAQCRILEGRILQNQGNHVRAVRSFETIGKKQYPVRPMYNALYYAAISYMKLGQEDKALQKLTLFIRHGRESRLLYDAQLELARIYRSRNEGDKSLVLCYDIIENAKRRLLITEAVNIAGDIYLKRENYRQARTVAENIRQYDITYDTRDSYI
ncbi:MAG: tetratricopeptide repeat protein, partial [Spirochaetota bacterium]